jgi:hypothetical protein
MKADEPVRPANPKLVPQVDEPAEPSQSVGPSRCKRCRKPISSEEYERFFERTGLCFWCAYVDPQG